MSYQHRLPIDTKLLVTAITRFELDAASEVWHALRATGVCEDANIIFIKKGKRPLRGLFGVIFDSDPILAVEKIRNYFLKRPWIMRFSQGIVPIEFITNELNRLVEFIEIKGQERIKNSDSWKIRVQKHESKVSKKMLIERIASKINKGIVNLSNPDWVINVEVVVETYAVAIVRPYYIIRKKELKDKEQYKENNVNHGKKE